MVQISAKETTGEDGYIPFNVRFRAWWHGVEPDALVKSSTVPESVLPNTIHVASPDASSGWSPARTAFCQRLWGAGFVDPGGSDFTLHLLKPCALGPEHTVLDLTTGLAGSAQATSDKFGIWVDATEPDADLAQAAQQRCEQKGIGKVKVSGIDPSNLALRKSRYDCIFVRERFHSFEDKRGALEAIREALKPKGQLILTDFVKTKDDLGPATKKWQSLTKDTSEFLAAEDYRGLLGRMKFDVMIFEVDPTDFRCRILDGWTDFVDQLQKDELTREFVDVLMVEAEKWLALTRALDAGEINYLRVHAMRPKFAK